MEIDADIAGMDGEDMVDEIMTLRQRVSELEAYNQVLLESQGQFRSDLQAARVEGLRRALELFHKTSSNWEWKNLIDAEIAALERGKE